MQYRYDCMGNIVEIFENGRTVCRYEYDSLGRLTREDNVDFAKTTTWAYDNNGNIIAKYEYELTAKPTNELHLLDCNYIPYTYDDNSDQLLSYGNETFVYDTIGNPTTYRGKNVMWTAGRRLMIYDGGVYGYDARGRRISKNGVTFTYDSSGNIIKQSNGLVFMYDHTGVFAVQYNGATYYYRKDAQANIVALLDNTGTVVVKYKYDAWGKCKVLDATGAEITDNTHIGILNPFRYRSYYFEHGIGLYFLKTRHYDPEIGRFMTIDDISYLDPDSINGLNLYAYCLNNPVMMTDDNGCLPNWAKWLLGAVVIIGLGIATAFTGGAAGVILGAAFYGALTGAVSGALVSGIIGGITGGWQGFWNSAASGFMSGAIIGGATGALSAGINYISGGVKIIGTAQKGLSYVKSNGTKVTGTFFHRMASNIRAGKMAMQIGRYSQIALDQKLNKVGLVGTKMPDVIGKARWGKDLLVEVVSKSQTALQMKNKLKAIQILNPNAAIKVIKWAGWVGRWLI